MSETKGFITAKEIERALNIKRNEFDKPDEYVKYAMSEFLSREMFDLMKFKIYERMKDHKNSMQARKALRYALDVMGGGLE